jgi:hypothetical protein
MSTDELSAAQGPHPTLNQHRLLIISRVLWVSLAAFIIVLYIAALPVQWGQLAADYPQLDISLWDLGLSINFPALYSIGTEILTLVFFIGTASVLLWSKSRDWMTILVATSLLTMGVSAYPTLDAFASTHPQWLLPVQLIQAVGFGSALLVFYLFPTGKFIPHWTLPLTIIWGIWMMGWTATPESLPVDVESWPVLLQSTLLFVFRTDVVSIAETYDHIRLYSLGVVIAFWFGSGIFAQLYRFKHHSDPTQRQQTKWVVLGISAAAIGYLLTYFIFGPASGNHSNIANVVLDLASKTMLSVCLMLVPLAIGISILRFQLWNVDFLINQTLVYSALTAFVGLFYIADVILLQAIFRAFTGRSSDVAIVISTLVIGAIFLPLRQRLQNFIDRLFFREKVDFRKAFTDFSLEIRTIIDLDELLSVLATRVTNLLHIQHAAVFLASGTDKFILAKSINIEKETAKQLPVDTNTLQRLRNSSAVVNDRQSIFPLLVPLMAPRASDNQFIGILALGPQRSGRGYSRDDRALLYSLADQAGTAIHVAQLIEEKQSEAEKRQTAERSLEEYRNSPAGQAEALAQELHQSPDTILAKLYQLATQAGKNPQIANLLDNLPQALENLQADNLANLSQGIDYIYKSQWTPDLLPIGLRMITTTLDTQHRDFLNGNQIYKMYGLFERAIDANSIPDIIELSEDKDWEYVNHDLEHLSSPTSDGLSNDLTSIGYRAFEALPGVITALDAYERVDTSGDKISYLAAAVERLRHVEHLARTSDNSPDRPIVLNIADTWLSVITRTMADIQASAKITSQLLTRNTWRNEMISLVLNIRNDGRGAAVNIQVTLAPGPEYTLINASDTIERLSPGEETQLTVRVRPHLEQDLHQFRARFVIRYTDPRGTDQVENFADIVQLMTTPAEFKFIPNPYVVGTPLQTGSPLFFGRQDVVDFIKENLAAKHTNNLVLIGQRRTGKTSLLKQLPEQLGDEYLSIYLDGQSLGLDPGLPNFFLNIATEISFVLEDRGFEIDPPEYADFEESPSAAFEKNFLASVRQAIGERHILILLDEFEELEAAIQRGNLDSSVFSFLRHIIQHVDNLSVTFCGTHRIEELATDYWNVLFNISLYRSIGLLDKDDAQLLIQNPVSEYGMRFDDLAIDKIWRTTAGHPYFLQLLCHSLVNLHNKTKRGYVTISDVNAALDEIQASGEAHFVYLWAEASNVERLVLTSMSRMIPLTGSVSPVQVADYLSERGVTLERQAIQQALHRLTLRDVLSSQEDIDHDAYRWKLGLLGMWIEKFKSLSRVLENAKETL